MDNLVCLNTTIEARYPRGSCMQSIEKGVEHNDDEFCMSRSLLCFVYNLGCIPSNGYLPPQAESETTMRRENGPSFISPYGT